MIPPKCNKWLICSNFFWTPQFAFWALFMCYFPLPDKWPLHWSAVPVWIEHTPRCGGLLCLSPVQIDFVPSPQPTANLEVSWRNEIASDGIDSHLTGLTRYSGPRSDAGRRESGSMVYCTVESLDFSFSFISLWHDFVCDAAMPDCPHWRLSVWLVVESLLVQDFQH